ncbi:hypothetical protein H0H92_000327 [Tricholoma furcatifolium]|nr:hypothetical protein H0H92_000327 [Tricholoma furcatifolium]
MALSKVGRLPSASRKISTLHVRKPWRIRSQRVLRRLPPDVRASMKLRRVQEKQDYREALQEVLADLRKKAEEFRQRFGKHSAQYYFEAMIQTAHRHKKSKAAGSWSAFISLEVKRRNEALPAGAPKKKANDYMSEISAEWKLLSPEERLARTQEKVAELRDTREMRELAPQNVPIASFHDIRATLDGVDKELQQLHERTGVEIVMIAVRAKKEDYNQPHVLTTSDRVRNFFELTMKENPLDISVRMEAYMLSGVQAVVRNFVEENIRIRSEISSVVLLKLKQVTKSPVARMYYSNFEKHITSKHGVIIRNWPLKKFCSPSDVQSRMELNVLLNAWKSDTCHFYKLTRDEFEAWEHSQATDHNFASSATSAHVDAPSTMPPDNHSVATPQHDISPPVPLDNPNISPPAPLDNVVNTVSNTAGSVVFVTKKARKVRKDKGTKRRKPTSSENVAS